MNIEAPNLAFRAAFEPDIGNSGSIRINCHCPLNQGSCSKGYIVRRLKKIYGKN